MNTGKTFWAAVALATALLSACGSDEDDCAGAVIEASTDAIQFGSLVLDGPRGVQGNLRLPESRTVFLKNRCSAPLEVKKACLIENAHDGDESTPAYSLEYEPGLTPPIQVKPAKDTAIRITFDVASINTDANDDGDADYNRSILLVFSNASNGRVTALPVCGRAVDDLDVAAAGAGPCELPSDFDVSMFSEASCGD